MRKVHAPSRQPGVVPELSKQGTESMLRVALAADNPVMRNNWDELEPHVLQHLDLLSDEQFSRLLAVPHWMEKIQSAYARLTPRTQVRIDALRPRKAIGRIWRSIRDSIASLGLPAGITLIEADAVSREYRLQLSEKTAETLGFLTPAQEIGLMNDLLREKFPDHYESIRWYFYEREGLLGAG